MLNGAAEPPMRSRAQAKRDRRAAEQKASGGVRSVVIPDLALWNASSRIGGGLRPAQISNIIRQADGGDMRQLMDLANECRQRDTHLQAVLATQEESIAGLSWQLTPPDDARAKDKRAAKWAEAALRSNPNLTLLIAHLAGAVYYSYAVAEIVWQKLDGKLVPLDFRGLAPRRFGFRRSDGVFVWRDDGMPTEGVDFRKAYPRRFVVATPRVTGDIATREGLARVLVWPSVFANWVVSDWLRTAEIAWKPYRIGTYKKASGTNNEDRKTLEEAMRRLTSDTATIKPDTVEIEFNWPDGSTTAKATHSELYNTLNNGMSKAVLGQTETTQSSTSSGYAQAKVHDAVRRDLLEARARYVASVLTRDLVAPLIDLNFQGIRAPKFEFLTQDPVDLKAFAEALKNLREASARIPESWFYDQTGIPEPKDGEACLGDADEEEDPDSNDDAENPDEGEGPRGPEGEEPPEDEKPAAEPAP